MSDANLISMDPKREGKNAKVAQTNIVEELGQISYLFSDKTGTLTRNEMTFKAMCVGGQTSHANAEIRNHLFELSAESKGQSDLVPGAL